MTTSFYEPSDSGSSSKSVDEIKIYYDCRYLSPCEAMWRIFSYDIHYRDPAVERLVFHLLGEQYLLFDNNRTVDDVIDRSSSTYTKFLAWFDANAQYEEAKTLTYNEFPTKFEWKQKKKKKRCWSPRKRGLSIGRTHFVPLGSGEIYYMRTMLNFVRGPTCYADLRKVGTRVHPTFRDACYAMGLLDDDKEYIDAMKEASHWGTSHYLRILFVTLLIANQMTKPEYVFEETFMLLSEDILYIQRRLHQSPGIIIILIYQHFVLFLK